MQNTWKAAQHVLYRVTSKRTDEGANMASQYVEFSLTLRASDTLSVSMTDPKKLEPIPSDVLDVSDLATLLLIHPVTVRLKAASGETPGRQIGNRCRFSRKRVMEWLADED